MDRNRSVLISLGDTGGATVDNPTVLRTEILNALVEINYDKEDIEGIECSGSNRWYVVFQRSCTRSLAVGKKLKIGENEFVLRHPNPQKPRAKSYTTVRVYGYPLEADREILKKALLYYGDVKSARDLTDPVCDVKTGVRELKMDLKRQIPSFIFTGKHQIKTTYWGQTRTCRKCHQEGHLAKDCVAGTTCRECGSTEHKKAECPNQKCYFCQGLGHIEANCPKYYEYPDMGGKDNEESNEEEKTPDDGKTANDGGQNSQSPNNQSDVESETETIIDETETERETKDVEESNIEEMETTTKEEESVEDTTIRQNRNEKNNAKEGETPKNGNSPDGAEDKTNIPTREQQTTAENNQKEAEKEKESDEENTQKDTDQGKEKSSEQAEDLTKKESKEANTERTDEEKETKNQKKRMREQQQSPNKKNKRRQPTNVSWAKNRNPFFK